MDKIYKLSAFKNELAKYPSFNDCLMFQPGLLFTDTFFGSSLDLSKYSNQVEKIGANSANGFIRKLTYNDNSLSMNVILKSNKSSDNDNLYYEYLAGQCINEFSKFYPFFSRTYALGKYTSFQNFRTFNLMASGVITTLTSPLPNFIQYLDQSDFERMVSESCENALYMTVFTQLIPIQKSLMDYFYNFVNLADKTFQAKYQIQLTKHISLLFMIYGCLHKLSNYFTHYDLHMDNIVLYSIPYGKYIEVEAKTETGIISFKTKYLPIIIDYGRSYFNCSAIEAGLVNSPTLMKSVCSKDSRRTNVCPTFCGNEVGYAFSGDYKSSTDSFNETTKDNYFINRAKSNQSHDLRGLSDLKRNIDFSLLDASIPYIGRWKQMLANMYYESHTPKYGKPETPSVSGQVNNVNDVFQELTQMMMEPQYILDNNTNNTGTSYGKLVLDFSQATMQRFQFVKL